MPDWYLWLTPLLVVAVLPLARFVGCHHVFGVEFLPIPPENIAAVPGDQRVDLSWTHDARSGEFYRIFYGTQADTLSSFEDADPAASGDDHVGAVTALENGTTYFFNVQTRDDEDAKSVLDPNSVVSATPGVTPFVMSSNLGPPRNNFQGWVGMAIVVGAAPIRVTQLGRMTVAANAAPHAVKIVEVVGAGPAGVDVPGGATTVTPTGPSGEFAFSSLAQPITLMPGRRYYIVSHETTGGDFWHDLPTEVNTTAVATVTSAVFNDDATPAFVLSGPAGQSYVPVNFRYA